MTIILSMSFKSLMFDVEANMVFFKKSILSEERPEMPLWS